MRRTADGIEIDEARLDEWGDSIDEGGLSGFEPVRPVGRPKVFAEELDTISWKAPRSQRLAMDARAESLGETRSQYLRRLVAEDLAQA